MLNNKLKIKPLSLIVALALGSTSAHAVDFNFGEDNDILLQINSQLNVGASWRLKDIDPAFISNVNGGSAIGSSATDDGNQNYAKHDVYSQIVKGVHDIQLSKGDFGAFVRFKYWYDKALENGDVLHGNSNNGYVPNTPLSDDGFTNNAKFSGIQLLDAYVYSSFDIGEIPVDIRIGRQVVSWGESTFIQGGINAINPFDVSALRRPGATLKEGLMPVGILYTNVGISESLSVEAFYQYEWDKTQVDGCGTYFSTADFVADGCNWVTVNAADQGALALGLAAKREADIEPDDAGQYGIAARYFSEALNDTEFGFYYMNYHSRLPMINAIRSDLHGITLPHPVAGDMPLSAAVGVFAPWGMTVEGSPLYNPALVGALTLSGVDMSRDNLDALNPGYTLEFPEDLKLYGVSFATNVAGFALSGEVSYRPDTPVQINGNHVLASALAEAPLPFTSRLVAAGSGATVRGWDTFDVTQVQLTGIQFFEQVLGASRLSLIGEVGATFTDGVEDMGKQGYFYGRNPVFGLDPTGQSGGYVTDSAWGYRLLASLQYADVFAGVALKPTFTWFHDVSGYGAEPGAQFQEGRKTLGFSLEASYLQNYTATLGFKSFSGGDYNTLEDKDFISLSFGISY